MRLFVKIVWLSEGKKLKSVMIREWMILQNKLCYIFVTANVNLSSKNSLALLNTFSFSLRLSLSLYLLKNIEKIITKISKIFNWYIQLFTIFQRSVWSVPRTTTSDQSWQGCQALPLATTSTWIYPKAESSWNHLD